MMTRFCGGGDKLLWIKRVYLDKRSGTGVTSYLISRGLGVQNGIMHQHLSVLSQPILRILRQQTPNQHR